MQKAEAEKLLHQSPVGTFLIRFSDGEPGGISVAWVTGECGPTIVLVAGGLCQRVERLFVAIYTNVVDSALSAAWCCDRLA